jgi:diguanylate cyclase (GGDEF)-like protein
MHDEVRSLAFYDPLTSLPNRRLLTERLKVALAASKRSGRACAVLLVDLDHFKQVNDTLGHAAGDSLLQEVSHRLSSSLRESDIVGRWGGDEFIVVLENLHEQTEVATAQIARIGKTIMAKLNKPYTLGSQDYNGTVSIGAALCGKKLEDEDEVFKRADKALYIAKADGRNRLCFGEP